MSDEAGWFVFSVRYADGSSIEMRRRDDSNLDEVADTIAAFLVAAGFDNEKVLDLFK
jgi:hypothetical protein